MEDKFYSTADVVLKWLLYIWRTLFWIIVASCIILANFDMLPDEFVRFFFAIFILILTYKVLTYIVKFIVTVQEDLQMIKRKLGLKARLISSEEKMLERMQYVGRRVKCGISFSKLREYYIARFGFKRWLTDGRGFVEHCFKEENMDKNGNSKLYEESYIEIAKEEE